MTTPTNRTIRSSLLATILVIGGCGDLTDDAPLQDSPLQLENGAAKWPGGAVPTCFTSASVARTNFATESQTVMERAADTWGREANIRFEGWGECPGSPQGMVRIDLVDDGAGFSCIGYPGGTGVCDMHLGVSRGDFAGSLVPHEFGHALGFSHEMRRGDFVDDSSGGCMESNVGGDTLGTPPDRGSIMASTGYCQNDPGLSRWDIVGVRNAYGAKAAGSLVGLHNVCVDIPLFGPPPPIGENLQVYDCKASANQQWRWTANSQLFAPSYSDSFLDLEGGTGANQSSVQIYFEQSPAPANQQFAFNDVYVKAMGETCVEVPGSNFADHTVLEISTCDAGSNQKWTIGADGTIRNGSFCWDVPDGDASAWNPIQIYGCHGGSNQQFGLNSNGEITFGGLCVDVAGGAPNDGSTLQLFPCKSSSDVSRWNQRFNVTGAVQSMGRCLDIRGGFAFNHAELQIYDCAPGAGNQTWDYYFDR